MDAELVSLYQCKRCFVRLYLRDCAGHYARCWEGSLADYQRNASKAFLRGPRTQHARPGGGYVPLHHARRGRPKKGVTREKPDDEDEDLAVN